MDSVGWHHQNVSIPIGTNPETQKQELKKLEWLVKTKILTPQYPNLDVLMGRIKVLTANLAPPVPTIPQQITAPYREATNVAGEKKEIEQIKWVLAKNVKVPNRTPEQLKARLELLQAHEHTRAEFLKKHPGSTAQEIPFGSGTGAQPIPSGFPTKR